ncbi:unnamed protein product [Urochloa decumbens]|uniref:Uncharacterized protein n=1 Tax=Urochloa decumbens TaxID=240449 RepID=A0ABC8ZPJ0_9POAL
MADKMPHLPPVSLAKKEEAAGPFPAVQFVSVWALFTSFAYALVHTVNRIVDTTPCDPCLVLTDAEAAKVDALWNGMAWYAAPQAAAAALALLLPLRRRRWMWIVRRALAYVALAAAIVSHLMYTSAVRVVLAADPWNFSFMIPCYVAISMFAVGDLLGFLAGPPPAW